MESSTLYICRKLKHVSSKIKEITLIEQSLENYTDKTIKIILNSDVAYPFLMALPWVVYIAIISISAIYNHALI